MLEGGTSGVGWMLTQEHYLQGRLAKGSPTGGRVGDTTEGLSLNMLPSPNMSRSVQGRRGTCFFKGERGMLGKSQALF